VRLLPQGALFVMMIDLNEYRLLPIFLVSSVVILVRYLGIEVDDALASLSKLKSEN
jgi:hypothetical protein